MKSDSMFSRLAKFLETAASVLNFFEAFLGRIEIKTADKVERVYFEIDEANIEEWEKPQIRESKNAFFHGIFHPPQKIVNFHCELCSVHQRGRGRADGTVCRLLRGRNL